MKKIIILIVICVSIQAISAQSTEFTYQGRLLDNGLPPTATYDFEFRLFDSLVGGMQQGGTQTVPGVAVTNGIFTVRLNFGNQFTGSARFLDISVRPAGGGAYTQLAPRQPISSSPYSVKSLNADTANTAATATNSLSLGGVTANNYLLKNGDASQLTNVNGANIINNSISVNQLSPYTLPNNYNLKLLASRRWDLLRNQATISVGSTPLALEFDGTNIWVTIGGSNSVAKIRASDGTVLNTINVGESVHKLAFDGTNIWVTHLTFTGRVTKIRASDGVILGTFTLGYAGQSQAEGIAFDGTSIWITDTFNNSVVRKNITNGGTSAFVPVGNFPTSVAFDGANIWVTGNSSGNVTKIRASDPIAILGTFPVNVSGAGAKGLAFDGANIWVAAAGGNITKLRASDGANLGTFTVSPGGITEGVGFDGVNIWVSSRTTNTIIKVRTSDGAILGTFAVGTDPRGIAFDGANIWVANSGSNNVTRLFPAFPQP